MRMPVVVADTGPLNYLVQIEAIDVLPKLFGKIGIPAAVQDELTHSGAPSACADTRRHARCLSCKSSRHALQQERRERFGNDAVSVLGQMDVVDEELLGPVVEHVGEI